MTTNQHGQHGRLRRIGKYMFRFPGRLAVFFLLTILAVSYSPMQPAFAGDSLSGTAQAHSTTGRDTVFRGIDLTAEEEAFLKRHPVIRVGNEDDWPPFDFSEHGRPKGYAIDYLELLEERLGLSFEYVNGYTWFELLGLLRQGEIDLLPCLWKTESRTRFMTFTESYLALPYVIVAPKGACSIQSVDELKGRTVAVAKGYKQEEVLAESHPEIGRYQVQNTLQGLEAVLYGEADAYIGYLGSVVYLTATRFMGSLQVCGESKIPELGPQGLHMAVRKEYRVLRDILQKAMDAVTDKQKVELSQKWIPVEEHRVANLTTEEKVFLRKHPVLRVDNLKNWPPFNFNSKGRLSGFCVDYMNLLADKLGIEIEYVSGPTWEGFMGMLQAGTLDCLCDIVETPDRRERIAFTDPYFSIFSGIVVRKDNDRYTRLKDLAGKVVAVPEDFYYEEILNRHYSGLQISVEKDILDCLKAVSAGKAEAALAEKPVFDYLINQHFLTDLKSVPIMGSRHFEDTPVSIGVRKDRRILVDILEKAMARISRQERAGLARRWINPQDSGLEPSRILLSPQERQWLEEKEALTICVRPSWLPFEALGAGKGPDEYRGIVADIIALLEKRIGVPIRPLPTTSWKESLAAIKNGKCDLLSSFCKDSIGSMGSMEESNFVLSKPYIESVNVMVARDDQPYIPDLHALEEKRLGVVQGNPVVKYLEEGFPGIQLCFYPDLGQALQHVSRGEVDAAMGSLYRVSHTIHQLGLYDLKIAGQTPYKESLCLGIRKDAPILSAIMNKAVASLSEREVSQVTRKWLSIRYDKGLDIRLLVQILAGGAFLISLFILWNRKLAFLNRKISNAHQRLAVKSRELEQLSVTDPLTGMFNRMKFEELLQHEIKRVQRTGECFSLIMLDVDNFKEINDSYGHQAGDSVLKKISGFLQASIREADNLGRWGGEEFLVLCPNTSDTGAATLAEHLRRLIAARKLTVAGGVTCSFGVAEYRHEEGESQLLNRVDRAMYRAKELGRNRVELAE
ncbi:MAG: transporter substrate-binding domain-containing protein [Thermodesulfobacteriota bacterium]|nr:transporter substrate-binding domain-containing protein [Thermodesulfobacteriota bacterium]